jgi:predicted Zn-dependent protease
MRKLVIQGSTFIFSFLVVWLLISRIDLVGFFEIEKASSQLEKSLGDFYMDIITMDDKEITDEKLTDIIDEIKKRICKENGIDAESLKIHLVRSSDVNAFALPDHHIVIYSELIMFCKTPEELAGIMSHEIAHIEKKHIMSKLSKEIGFAALSAMINLGGGGVESLKILTSSAYDRKMEDQADETAVEYLQKSKINPAALADVMFRFSVQESDIQKHLTFISTHPDSEKRAEKILKLGEKETIEYIPLLSDAVWVKLKEGISGTLGI